MLFKDIYRNKRVLVTGDTGFKGSWLTVWLNRLGAEVHGIADGIPTTPSHFAAAELKTVVRHKDADIRNLDAVRPIIHEIQPDFVFHLAAQALVRQAYDEPLETFGANAMGTANILESLRGLTSPCVAVSITSDKCYDNVEWEWGYRESDSLGGKDPYSASKGAAELVIKTWFHSFFNKPDSKVTVAAGRAGNVIGGGDWAADRIVPDCVRAWSENRTAEIRAPHSTRPWQHVLEPLSGYLTLGQKLFSDRGINGEPYNFGPNPNQNFSVSRLIEEMRKHWTEGSWDDVSDSKAHTKEANLLKLCCDKALRQLSWSPTMNFEETIQLTVDWYRKYYENPKSEILAATEADIDRYVELAEQRGMEWTG